MRSRVTTLLAVIGAATVLVLAANTVTLAATGKGLIAGKVNVSKKATTIKRTKPGPALKLKTKSGPPFTVGNDGLVPLLNADKLDGQDAGAFATKAQAATKAETVAARRLLWFGKVNSSGTLLSDAVLPGTTARMSTGYYRISVPGLLPGCQGAFPTFMVHANAVGFASTDLSSVTCATGDYSAYFATKNKDGAAADVPFNFLAFSGGASSGRVIARAGAMPTACEQRDGEFTCR